MLVLVVEVLLKTQVELLEQILVAEVEVLHIPPVSYTHLTLPTKA